MARTQSMWAIQTVVLLAFSSSAFGQWVKFLNQSSTRIAASPANSTNDVDEKDFAWGDVDQDGDIDLISVRKEPFTSPGKRTNVLYMNENGILTDRTAEYATASDVPGDNGFLTLTNDRDVVLVDVDGDSWLDIVIAPTLSDGDPKNIGHPRIYMNRGLNEGVWQGFRYEASRIPTMVSVAGQAGNPRFCSVAAGDLTGDGFPELWFGDYDSAGVGGQAEAPGQDFDDRLLLNDGNGFFTDVTNGPTSRFSGTITVNSGSFPFQRSAFGAAGAIADMNGDGKLDIVKQTALADPRYIGIAYNKPTQQGFFEQFQAVNQDAPYFFSVGDLNNDGRLDIVSSDDGTDRYMLNTGNAANGMANFTTILLPNTTGGFGSQSVIVDLNNDGWNDLLISDVDVDIPPCTSRQADILRNNGNAPNVTFTADSGNIPGASLVGVHNFAVFDLNGDGWMDIVAGRCGSVDVWINDPPANIEFDFPQGLPAYLPDTAAVLQIHATPTGGAILPGSGVIFFRINGGAWSNVPMSETAPPGTYEATLPAAACAARVEFYVRASLASGAMFTGPSGAPANGVYLMQPNAGTATTLEGFEIDEGGFTVVSAPSMTLGMWERAIPNGTLSGGVLAAPNTDGQTEPGTDYCFVTDNGPPGSTASQFDVDGGPTDLISPPIDLAGTDATISFAAWQFSTGGTVDVMTVSVSNNDGASWTTVMTVGGTGSSWQNRSFVVSQFFPGQPLTSNVRVRFRSEDIGGVASTTESGIDAFRVTKLLCASACSCPADMNSDGKRSGGDIQAFVNCSLGGSEGCDCADLDGTPGIQPADTALFVDAVLLGDPCAP